MISSFLFAAVFGLPCRLPLLRASAIPAFTRSFNIERSNSAKTASIPAKAFPDGVVKSKDSFKETKQIPREFNSSSVVIRSARLLPNRSNLQTRIQSIFLCLANFKSSSRFGRLFAPDATSDISIFYFLRFANSRKSFI